MIALLSDLEMIIHKFPDRPDLRIYPVSDVHFGAAEHMTRAWEQFCQSLMAQENAYVILGGDLINNATRNSVSNVFEETMRPREQKKRMVEMLTPIKEKILCMVSGNHERRSLKDADDDPSYDIACKLDIEHLYRENVAFVKIQIKVVSATSWLEWGGYAAQKMLNPSSHAPQIITLRGTRKEMRVEM